MNEYVSEKTLYFLWIVGSFGIFGITFAILRWSIFIGDVKRKILVFLAILSGFWGVVSLISGFTGLLLLTNYAVLSTIRISGNTAMPWIVAIILNWIVYASYRMPPEQQDLVRQASRAFDRLGNVLHNTK